MMKTQETYSDKTHYSNGVRRNVALEKVVIRNIGQYKQLNKPDPQTQLSYLYQLHSFFWDFFNVVQEISVMVGPQLTEFEINQINKVAKGFQTAIIEAEKVVPYSQRTKSKKYDDSKHWSRTFKATWINLVKKRYLSDMNKLVSKYNQIYVNPFISLMAKSDIKIKVHREGGFHILGRFKSTI